MIWASLLLLILVILVPASYKTRAVNVIQNDNQGVQWIDDFLAYTTLPSGMTDFLFLNSEVTGAAIATNHVPSLSYIGTAQLSTNVTEQYACFRSYPTYTLSETSSVDMQTRLHFTTLPTGGNAALYQFGLLNNHVPADTVTNGAAFVYDSGTSNFWIARVVAAGVTTNVITNVLVENVTDTYLRIIIATGRCLFYINNVLVANIAASPAASATYIVSFGLTKTVETTGQTITVLSDAVTYKQKFTVPRQFVVS